MKRMARLVREVALAGAALAWGAPAWAQTSAGCGANGYRVIGSRWDAVLQRGWQLRQDCAHPEWPARSVAVSVPAQGGTERIAQAAVIAPPVLVHAGDAVNLWMQDALVRIEMSGVAEEPARLGERVVVRVTRQSDDAGLVEERIGGIVRGAGNVEIER